MVVGLAAVLSWVVAGRILRPIRSLTAAAHRMATDDLSSENLSRRVPVTRPADEMAALAETFNGMPDRIQSGLAERDRLLAAQRMFVANAAHELRTPLATMRTAIDVTMDGDPGPDEVSAMTADLGLAIERSRRTLDGLLALAHSQTGPIRREPVDLSSITAAILDRTDHPTIQLRRSLAPAPLRGDPNLTIMVGNLVDNAVRYNRPCGHVHTTTGATDGEVILRVVNTGDRLDAESTDRLWEPFVRGRNNHGTDGAGLGMSIVRAIAGAHEGHVSAAPGPDGGLTVTITLPPAR